MYDVRVAVSASLDVLCESFGVFQVHLDEHASVDAMNIQCTKKQIVSSTHGLIVAKSTGTERAVGKEELISKYFPTNLIFAFFPFTMTNFIP